MIDKIYLKQKLKCDFWLMVPTKSKKKKQPVGRYNSATVRQQHTCTGEWLNQWDLWHISSMSDYDRFCSSFSYISEEQQGTNRHTAGRRQDPDRFFIWWSDYQVLPELDLTQLLHSMFFFLYLQCLLTHTNTHAHTKRRILIACYAEPAIMWNSKSKKS